MKITPNSNACPAKVVKSRKAVKSESPHVAAMSQSTISIDTGLIVALVDSAVDSDTARQILTQQVMKGGVDLGIQFPKSKIVRSWHAGGERNKAHIETANSLYPEPPFGVKRFVRCLEVDHRFNWLSDAAFMVTSKTIKGTEKQSTHGDCNLFLQNGAALEDPNTMQALFKLRHEAKSAGNHLMVIIGGVSKLSDSAEKLFSLCDEVLTVEACEPDADASYAIKIAVPSLHHSHQFGKGVIMASLIRGQSKFTIKVESFIATGLKQRLAWRLSGTGKSLDEIGEYLGINKSTASRWLQKMPPVKQASITDAQINQALEAVECLPIEKKSTAVNPAFSVQREAQSKRKVR